MILKGESYVSWANRINQQTELADLKNIKAQDLQLMTFCKGLSKTDCLYDKIVDMEIHSWSGAQEIIKKHTQSMALKSDLLESSPKSPQGQIMNQMSQNKGSNKSQERSQSGAHECWTCHEIVEGNHFGYNCPKGEKEGEEKRPITPYPRKDRSPSGEKTKASQGNKTYRRFRGYFGNPGPGPWKVISRSPATADPGAAPAAVTAALAQPDAITAPGGGLREEDRGEVWGGFTEGDSNKSPLTELKHHRHALGKSRGIR